MEPSWNGIYCALWTPTDERGELIESVLRDHLTFLDRSGVRGLLALGSTGEFLWLDRLQRKHVAAAVLGAVRGLQVMVNISHIQPRVAAELGLHAQELGASAVTALPPYFYPMPQCDLVEFFAQTGKESGLPLFLYNFPERTGNRIELETIAAVADRVPVAGIKHSGGDFGYHAPLVELGQRHNFSVLTGSDTRLIEAMEAGVQGCVSGLANAVPELVVGVYENVRAGDMPQAKLANDRLNTLAARIGELPFPLDVGAAIEARGIETGADKTFRAARTEAKRQRVIAELKELYQEWKLL